MFFRHFLEEEEKKKKAVEALTQFTEKRLNICDKHTDSLLPKCRFSIIKSIQGVHAFRTYSFHNHISNTQEVLILFESISR